MTVANLRTAAGQDPHDKGLHDLVGELSTRSEEFRRRWNSHDVRTHGAGVKHFHHHVVGDLELAYESLDLRAEPGLTLTVYAAEPASPTAHALTLLASWAATGLHTADHPSSNHLLRAGTDLRITGPQTRPLCQGRQYGLPDSRARVPQNGCRRHGWRPVVSHPE